MKQFITLLSLLLVMLPACSQSDTAEGFVPDIRQPTLPIGQSVVELRQLLFKADTPFLLLQLHSDETTGAETAEALARRQGIPFLQVINNGRRLLAFRLGRENFQIDPNRIFSDEGIRKTLLLSSHYTMAAFTEVQRFRDTLLSFIDTGLPVVAVHNNTEGRFTVLQYRNVGGASVYINETHDVDDFFITNDSEIFDQLQAANFSVVLENAEQMEDDGSLSLYCARKKIRYINVEAQHGHTQQQASMLNAVATILKQ